MTNDNVLGPQNASLKPHNLLSFLTLPLTRSLSRTDIRLFSSASFFEGACFQFLGQCYHTVTCN